MNLQEFIDREHREAVTGVVKENKKVKEELKATAAERDKAQADQRNFQKLTSILLDKNLVGELKRAVDDDTYRESLYVEFGVKPPQE